jgi:hypothetical protein
MRDGIMYGGKRVRSAASTAFASTAGPGTNAIVPNAPPSLAMGHAITATASRVTSSRNAVSISIPVAYRNCYKHGGSFHCSTLDVRRRGRLDSYF